MKESNKYWDMELDRLRLLRDEQIILLMYANYRKNYERVREHEKELEDIIDAIASQRRAINRGLSNGEEL